MLGNNRREKIESELSGITDQELLDEYKKLKSFSITSAFLVGLLIGILVYSVVKQSWGLLSLIPVYLIYKITLDPKNLRTRIVKRKMRSRGLRV